MPAPSGRANRAGPQHGRAALALSNLVQGPVLAALGSIFNFLALNLVVLIACLPVLTIPLALVALTIALDRWRGDGEDRVVREFFFALRSRPPLATTLVAGVPLVVAAIGAEEVHYFAHGGEPVDWVCLGFGLAALVLALGALGYVLLLVARRPTVPATEVWALGVGLALRNLFATGPLFVVEIVAATLLGLLDPALLMLGLPVGLLSLMRLTARFGLRRARLGD